MHNEYMISNKPGYPRQKNNREEKENKIERQPGKIFNTQTGEVKKTCVKCGSVNIHIKYGEDNYCKVCWLSTSLAELKK